MSSGQAGVLLVHAHPDDESICNGVTMAACVAAGIPVTLVTCTLGEEGDVIPASLKHLAAKRDDALGPRRADELAAAMRALGVTDHRFLGGRGRWRDSGMAGLEINDRPDAFCNASIDEAGEALADIIAEVRPRVLITYDPTGGYGHPDHIMAHRVTMYAAELAAKRHRVARVLWNCAPRSVVETRMRDLLSTGGGRFRALAGPGDLPGVIEDPHVALTVTGTPEQVAAKTAAMTAHATQIQVDPDAGLFALSNNLAQPLWETEYYRLAGGEPVPAGAQDIFAGLEGGARR
ncbi:N-acetyl-1-D-myo-inositol-2-amino-2-deoxy-alpha-D-glucopyranoside deacetylase [Streptomyces marincola]|uniref:1D-myo-inositol 2-acetamido-2-deoxy-alpha-D-glucopyranoside deacetylase n=1 Tax=Streptomyces marincola TaxID=2878388 RepID=A0A1W7CVH1_9ACTN|nr:N-acetyl-1-D-myo-inositol-2-amino-2-deoxy-alpha-D-glucopyranoside deacetylase [Streptomyces marincola]ARQ68765.1 N-acetyl-1-D-myo-inositol-2-amino-2-deoxy-alpha-D-glucopyranoside deacetylase [Streptomyces marincola]